MSINPELVIYSDLSFSRLGVEANMDDVHSMQKRFKTSERCSSIFTIS